MYGLDVNIRLVSQRNDVKKKLCDSRIWQLLSYMSHKKKKKKKGTKERQHDAQQRVSFLGAGSQVPTVSADACKVSMYVNQ